MDPFTQRMLEKAEQRSRALGISSAPGKFPLTECSSDVNTDVRAVVPLSTTAAATATPAKTKAPLPPQQIRTPAHNVGSVGGNGGNINKLQVVEKAQSTSNANSPSKVLRQFSAVDKENMDLGIEINIVTDKNVEVQVQVEEQEITDDEHREQQHALAVGQPINQPLAKIRDSSRNRLQRLGALYSNTDDLSSPIHRTEGQFHAGSADDTGLDGSPKRPKQRYGKLVALANSINEWEDDTVHHHVHPLAAPSPPSVPVHAVPPPKPDLPSRRLGEAAKKAKAPAPPGHDETCGGRDLGKGSDAESNKTKQLKWDPKVITSLEAQGFQRRESSTVKLAYEYNKEDEEEEKEDVGNDNEAQKQSTEDKSKPAVGKLTASVFAQPEEKKVEKKPMPSVKPGLVSGRAAVFESKASSSQQVQKPQKDPTELSLRERMQLFERNKGEALVPKAAFGMAPSIAKIRQGQETVAHDRKKDETKASTTHSTNAAAANQETNKVREKVAALVANASTMSENKIKADINKQRQEDMQILANRFNRQKEIFARDDVPPPPPPPHQQQQQQQQFKPKDVASHQSKIEATKASLLAASSVMRPPPPPPPPPQATQDVVYAISSKRRSPGDAIDDDESKRARKSNVTKATPAPSKANRLYPGLSDLEFSNESGTEEEEDNGATTATASARSTADERQPLRSARRSEHEVAAEHDNDTDSFMESEAEDSSVDICNGSLGREIMQVVQKNEQQQQQQQVHGRQIRQVKEVRYAEKNVYYEGVGGGDSSLNTSDEASMGMDDYLDEALNDRVDDDGDDDFTQDSDEDDATENTSRVSRGSKGTTTSNSFSFRKTPKKYTNYQAISEEQDIDDYHQSTGTTAPVAPQPVTSELSVNREDENMVTLVHTVSFYRRQQTTNSASSTPVRRICREQQVTRSAYENAHCSAATTLQFDSPDGGGTTAHDLSCSEAEETQCESDVEDGQHLVQEKIKKLLDEVCKQQQIIAQTSQALNLCAATVEFSGSTESVEGERHLLVATHRRQACLDEVQRLRVEHSLRPLGAPREKGRLTVKEITVPLRQDYIRKLAADTISGHHLVCLLKYNEYVLATKTVPTLPGLLAVKFPDLLQMNNVYADFRITLEIYGMTAQREVLPHEVKYHINLNKKSGVKTPKKKGSENRLFMPPVQSPAGPNVVRTPALVQYGFAIFSLREIQRTSWTLTQVLGVSPLEGIVHMKVNCELSVSVDYKGFLTMFEDISGFGAWHRRWCHLNGTVLNYWKYPDDEKKKTPMGSIDLYMCSSQKVGIAPRDICARLNTMLLECQRPAKDSDQESLIIVPNGRTTTVRHLLSADTKEEREVWCAYFNKALTLLRAWGPPQ